MPRPARRLLLVAMALAPLATAHAHADVGTPVQNAELRTASGGKERLLAPKVKVTAVAFVRAGQERSVEALKALATCERELAGKPVRFVAVVPGDTPPEEALSLVAATGIRMPLLLDDQDALYEQLGVRNHPVVFVLDAKSRVASFEQFRQIDYCDVIAARIRFLLGEIDQAALDRMLEPPRNTLPGEDVKDVSLRHVHMGRRQLKIGQLDKALASARIALEQSPSGAGYALVGDIAAARGDCGAALKHYQKALEVDPAEPYAQAGQRACAGK